MSYITLLNKTVNILKHNIITKVDNNDLVNCLKSMFSVTTLQENDSAVLSSIIEMLENTENKAINLGVNFDNVLLLADMLIYTDILYNDAKGYNNIYTKGCDPIMLELFENNEILDTLTEFLLGTDTIVTNEYASNIINKFYDNTCLDYTSLSKILDLLSVNVDNISAKISPINVCTDLYKYIQENYENLEILIALDSDIQNKSPDFFLYTLTNYLVKDMLLLNSDSNILTNLYNITQKHTQKNFLNIKLDRTLYDELTYTKLDRLYSFCFCFRPCDENNNTELEDLIQFVDILLLTKKGE